MSLIWGLLLRSNHLGHTSQSRRQLTLGTPNPTEVRFGPLMQQISSEANLSLPQAGLGWAGRLGAGRAEAPEDPNPCWTPSHSLGGGACRRGLGLGGLPGLGSEPQWSAHSVGGSPGFGLLPAPPPPSCVGGCWPWEGPIPLASAASPFPHWDGPPGNSTW